MYYGCVACLFESISPQAWTVLPVDELAHIYLARDINIDSAVGSSGRVSMQSLQSAEQLLARGAAVQRTSRGSHPAKGLQLLTVSEGRLITCQKTMV